jgi:cation:H+ antiporter
LAFSGHILVRSLSRIADFLGWKEFTVSFFIMSAATALPEFLVGISSAFRGVPELSFGNIIGQSIIHFTLAVFVCVAVAGGFRVSSPVVRASAWFSGVMAVLPVILIADGLLSRGDGLILILSFIFYSIWLFSKRDRFGGAYTAHPRDTRSIWARTRSMFGHVGIFVLGSVGIIAAAQGIISSTVSVSLWLGLPLVVVGALIVGIGTSLPEIYFSAVSARHKHGELMIGNLLGSTAVSVSMVLGAVALISPIAVPDLSPYLLSRVFLVIAVAAFILFIYTGRRISVRESVALLVLYAAFVGAEIFLHAAG